jgi:hypothetical protein
MTSASRRMMRGMELRGKQKEKKMIHQFWVRKATHEQGSSRNPLPLLRSASSDPVLSCFFSPIHGGSGGSRHEALGLLEEVREDTGEKNGQVL